MENVKNRELLDNIVITDSSTAPQYMIHRLPENTQLLSSELLQQHNGLVVDLGGSDFIPVSYTSEDLLSQDLTEEDRNLAAALVAVQLSQQQKQQQLQDATLPSLVANTSLGNKILEDSPLIISEKSGATSYLRIVNSENLYVEQQTLPKLVDTVRFSSVSQNYSESAVISPVKKEDEKADSDRESLRNDHRSSKKSLPHKKRISRKLKKTTSTSVRKIVCNLCEQTFNSNDDFAQHELLCQTTITPINQASVFSCQICNEPFQEQLRFFEHLKKHYEPGGSASASAPSSSPQKDTEQVQAQKTSDQAENDKQESLLSSLLNLSCIECNKTFRRQKTFEAHMRDIHSNKSEPLDEFSEPEDLMEGINVVVDTTDPHDDDDSKAWYREEDLHQTEEDLKELEADNGHVCHFCKQPFPLRAILLQHLVTCRATAGATESAPLAVVKSTNKRNKKKVVLNCTECDRVFTHRNSLVYHMRSHTGVRPHQCDQCGKSFFASSALKVHLRLHSGDKPYTCEHCERKFRQWGDLKYHITSLHSNEKNFQCEYCGKEFARKYSLVVHRRIHTEVLEVEEEEELSSELHIEDEEAAGQLLTEYNQESLEVERTVRVPNRNLYINGHELFFVTYPNEIRVTEPPTSTSSWVQASNT
ncbi:hypothetical protein NQ315_003824 [Exocentrus adspersus]|uniref:C2H2-type domain-containing protein n=1 Tax=Exocentrus adspersus TaxID=1586481 RepID=A0AAV8W052_9CUCU|nr:hypothetical protein NQ315_003824 [Exocentrus adspersus]